MSTNWTWANPAQREHVYPTLGDAPLLVHFDAVHAEITGTLRLSQQPEPTGYGPGLMIGRGASACVATRDLQPIRAAFPC